MNNPLAPAPRYDDEQLALAKQHLVSALESLAVAFWVSPEERFCRGFERSLANGCEALGFRLVPINDKQ